MGYDRLWCKPVSATKLGRGGALPRFVEDDEAEATYPCPPTLGFGPGPSSSLWPLSHWFRLRSSLAESLFKPAASRVAFGFINTSIWIFSTPFERTFFGALRFIEVSCPARVKLVKKIVLQCACLVRFTDYRIPL